MKKNKKWIILFLLPGILLFTFIFLGPIVVLFGTSFTDWSIGKEISFVGIKNYIYLFT
ncbi:MAG TPA: sugar ABC transporter permease, partial [Clostridiales bacterium]|nr:sugar ABC transporter permease [Clostridiales bacterium]